jgi:predicted transcriptional regulator
VAGKADWIAMGMPTEGTLTEATIQHVVSKVPTCGLHESLGDVKARLFDDWQLSVVIDPKRIVLGLLDLSLIRDLQGSIENLMKPAPLTLRPSVLIAEALTYFEQSNLTFALVTKSTGELLGAVRKVDLEQHRNQSRPL